MDIPADQESPDVPSPDEVPFAVHTTVIEKDGAKPCNIYFSYRLPSGNGQNMVAPKRLKNQKETHFKRKSPWVKKGVQGFEGHFL